MDTFSQAIISMVRKDLSDEQILSLVRDRLSSNGVEFEAPAVAPTQKVSAPLKGPKKASPRDLRPNEKSILATLKGSEGPMSIAQLQAKLNMGHGATTGALDKLTSRGLVNKTGEGGGKKRFRRFLFSAA